MQENDLRSPIVSSSLTVIQLVHPVGLKMPTPHLLISSSGPGRLEREARSEEREGRGGKFLVCG